jgi:hypothetical protein
VAKRPVTRDRSIRVFINCPFDEEFEPLFLAYIAGLVTLGLLPVTVCDLPASTRLDRLCGLIDSCASSIHDLSRVQLSGARTPVPRFNMPFELGLSVRTRRHSWFLFESRPHRLQRSLSDLAGCDAYIHDDKPRGVLRELGKAFTWSSSKGMQPSTAVLETVYRQLVTASRELKKTNHSKDLFDAHSIGKLIFAASEIANRAGGRRIRTP